MSAYSSISLGSNLQVVPSDIYSRFSENFGPAFRRTDDGRNVILIRDPEKQLTEEEICAINQTCDKHEGRMNKQVKSVMLSSIRAYFNSKADHNGFQLVEFGAGLHPLTKNNIRANSPEEYHAIEIDRDIITELKASGFSASTISDIPEGTLQTDRTRIAAGVYTIHFWEPEKTPDDIKRVISQDGFFVANYMTSKHNKEHKESMIESMRENGLTVSIVTPEATRNRNGKTAHNAANDLHNEFWVVSYPPEKNGMRSEARRFADTMVSQLNGMNNAGQWAKPRTLDVV